MNNNNNNRNRNNNFKRNNEGMRLNDLRSNEGARTDAKRVGRGESSGWGKSAGRGGNGQSARRGSSFSPSFEGGQTPYFRRVPKRGFSNHAFKEEYSLVNLDTLNDNFNNGDLVDKNALIAKGLVTKKDLKIKILAAGELDKQLTVIADKFSARAKERIEELKGTAEVLNAGYNK